MPKTWPKAKETRKCQARAIYGQGKICGKNSLSCHKRNFSCHAQCRISMAMRLPRLPRPPRKPQLAHASRLLSLSNCANEYFRTYSLLRYVMQWRPRLFLCLIQQSLLYIPLFFPLFRSSAVSLSHTIGRCPPAPLMPNAKRDCKGVEA